MEKRARKEERKEERLRAKQDRDEPSDHLTRLKQQGYDPDILLRERY